MSRVSFDIIFRILYNKIYENGNVAIRRIAINESSGLPLLVAPHMLRGSFGIAVGTEEIEIGTGFYIDE